MTKTKLFLSGFFVSLVLLLILFFRPLSRNEQALLLIDNGRMAETYEELKENCEKAVRIAEDPDIIKVADFWARGAMVMIAGRNRSQRDHSMTVQDFMNGVMAGLDPRIGWEGLRLIAESAFLRDEFKRIEENYGEYGYLSGKTRLGLPTILFLSLIVGSLVVVAMPFVSRARARATPLGEAPKP